MKTFKQILKESVWKQVKVIYKVPKIKGHMIVAKDDKSAIAAITDPITKDIVSKPEYVDAGNMPDQLAAAMQVRKGNYDSTVKDLGTYYKVILTVTLA